MSDRYTRSPKVVRLTQEERDYLDDGTTRGPSGCIDCGHLSLFHQSGHRDDGSHWILCHLCSCASDTSRLWHVIKTPLGEITPDQLIGLWYRRAWTFMLIAIALAVTHGIRCL